MKINELFLAIVLAFFPCISEAATPADKKTLHSGGEESCKRLNEIVENREQLKNHLPEFLGIIGWSQGYVFGRFMGYVLSYKLYNGHKYLSSTQEFDAYKKNGGYGVYHACDDEALQNESES